MIIIALIEFLKKHLRLVIWICAILLALLVVGDFFLVDKEHAHTKPEHWLGFWSGFGFIACLLIIFVSKGYGHLGIMKREDYYGDE
jgi:drug/metabolite transporter (DMT)-like permease